MKIFFAIISVLVVGFLIGGGLFTVNQGQQALVVRFGRPVKVIQSPGLQVKAPFIDEVTFFDKRLLDVELSALEVTLGDRRRVIVDAFARYKISQPLEFFQTVRDEPGAQRRLSTTILGSLRSVLGNLPLSVLLSEERAKVMKKIRDEVNSAIKGFGINVVDVRIRKTDLPAQNSEAIFKRMISERKREADKLRAEGIEKSQVIRSKVDQECAVMLANAEKQAEIARGEGEAEASKIYAEAFSKDQEFFSLYYSLDAYKKALDNKNTTFVLSPKGVLFKHINEEKR